MGLYIIAHMVQLFIYYIMARTSIFGMWWWWMVLTRAACSSLHKTNMLSWILTVLAHWNNCQWINMSHYPDSYVNQSYQCCMLGRETSNANFIVFDLYIYIYIYMVMESFAFHCYFLFNLFLVVNLDFKIDGNNLHDCWDFNRLWLW
jgi:hypothetical protein